MVNSGIIENVISVFLFNNKKFSILKKKNIYNLIVIDRNMLLTKNKKLNKERKLLLVITQYNYENISFNII